MREVFVQIETPKIYVYRCNRCGATTRTESLLNRSEAKKCKYCGYGRTKLEKVIREQRVC